MHLTADPNPAALPDSFRDCTVRITVEVSEPAHRWHAWAGSMLPSSAADVLTATHFGGGRPDEWFVLERAIPAAEWVSVIDLAARTPLWPEAV
ncbi:hypothetical protein ACFV3E_40980 [Streptomyces sp. NPDC059718]